MAYTTTAEIQADFKDTTFSTTTNVKSSEVEQFIVEADALINSYVGNIYQTPVTTGEGLQLLKLLCRSLVAHRIKKILEVVQPESDAQQNILGVLFSPTEVKKILNDLKNEDAALIGATKLVSSCGFKNKNVDNDVCAVIKKDERQW